MITMAESVESNTIVSLPPQQHATSSLAELVIAIQNALIMLDYNPGRTDGVYGVKTALAIQKFQQDHHLRTDGKASYKLFDALYMAKKSKIK